MSLGYLGYLLSSPLDGFHHREITHPYGVNPKEQLDSLARWREVRASDGGLRVQRLVLRTEPEFRVFKVCKRPGAQNGV